MDGNSINVEVNITEKDIYSFQKSFLTKRFSPITLVAICIFLVIFAIGSIIDKATVGSKPIGTVVLVLIPVILIFLIPFILKRYSKNALKTNKLLQKTQRYQIDNEGISVSSESGQGYIKWNEFYKAIETKESFLFFISKQQAYIVPKRCFEGNTEQFELLRSYMKNAPVPKDEKKGLFIKRGFGVGCLVYVLLFFAILVVLFLTQQ